MRRSAVAFCLLGLFWIAAVQAAPPTQRKEQPAQREKAASRPSVRGKPAPPSARKGAGKLSPLAILSYQKCAKETAQKKFAAAEEACKLALRRAPNFARAHNALALIYIQGRKLAPAQKHLQRALAIDPNYADALSNLGHIHYQRKNYKRAQTLFAAALKIDAGLTHAGYNLARVLIVLRQPKAAKIQLIKSLLFEKNRKFAPFYALLGYLAMREKQYQRALKHYLRVLRLRPGDGISHLNTCKLYYLQGQLAQACKHCQFAVKLLPRFRPAPRALGIIDAALKKSGKRCQ